MTLNTQFQDRLKRLRKEIDNHLANLPLPELPESLYKPMRYSTDSPGKRIRPILTLLTGEGLGVDREKVMPAALAVEVLHTFTLVHDDIMDNDTQRRGRATVHVKWDMNTAILSGDGLMALAFRLLMETDSPQIGRMGYEFSQAMLEICEGQALDVEFESRQTVSSEDYLEMVGKKTGRLLGLSCQLGALISSGNERIVDSLNRFGIELGQAFQIQDDLLELTSDAENMGKSLDSDIVSGKKTYPMVLAQSGMDSREKSTFIDFLKSNIQDRQAIINAFRDRRAIEQSQQKITVLLENAMARLRKLPERAANNLKFAVDMISNRQR
ncbi:MAG: polyprenyl synthetase family protein [Candidatus Marinimicrobia bacterium]|nr:polyprenyl synthetase family protein [Candidatus Neomarinimicrobiota bacterium]